MKIIIIAFLLTGTIFASDIQIAEPYPPKPNGQPPQGWTIKILEKSSIETPVQLSSGKIIKLKLPAYEIAPSSSSVYQEEAGREFLRDISEIRKNIKSSLEKIEFQQKEIKKILGEKSPK